MGKPLYSARTSTLLAPGLWCRQRSSPSTTPLKGKESLCDTARSTNRAGPAAVDGRDVTEVFMSAASPGAIALFLPDEHYGNREAYLAADTGRYRL